MSWRVVNGEAVPDFRGHFGAEDIAQGLAAMDVQVIHHQVNGFGVRVFQRQGDRNPGKFKAGTIGRGEGEMTSCFWFYGTENIGRAASFVFVVPSGFPTWHGRRSRSNIGVQRNRLFVQADHRLLCIVRTFIHLQDVLHLGDVVFIEIRHAPHFFPATA